MKNKIIFRKNLYPIFVNSFIIICILITSKLSAQEIDSSKSYLFESSVSDLLSIQLEENKERVLELAGKFAQTERQAPSIVTIINRDEIETWGARDLSELLRLIPGFEFGIDVQSLVGLSFRGIWAHEGKVLLMIDGMPVNCFAYGNTNFVGSYPLAMVEKIEIIRGPGSALYGGFAEVAVINMITQKGDNLKGKIKLNGYSGLIGKNLNYNGNISAGLSERNLDLSLHLGFNHTLASQRKYTDFIQNSYTLGTENSWRKWNHLVAQASYKGFLFKYNRNNFNFLAPDLYGLVDTLIGNKFRNDLYNFTETAHIQYQWKVSPSLTLTPTLIYQKGNSISTSKLPIIFNTNNAITYSNPSAFWENSNAHTDRWKWEIVGSFEKSNFGSLLFGGGYQLDKLKSVQGDGNPGLLLSNSPADTSDYKLAGTQYFFSQYNYQWKRIGITAGLRYENTIFGDAFAPRIGITYVRNKFNAKLLFGEAFRVPVLFQAFSRQYNLENLTPENTSTYEAELGYRFNDFLSGKVNVFYTEIQKPIVYLGASNSYKNFGEISTKGLEAEFVAKFKNWNSFLNFTFIQAGNQTSENFLAQNGELLAMPKYKINFGLSYVHPKWVINSTINFLSKKYGQSEIDYENQTLFTEYPSTILWNANFILKNIYKQMDLNLAISNILDTKYLLVQPNYGGHAPFPVADRQISLGLQIKL